MVESLLIITVDTLLVVKAQFNLLKLGGLNRKLSVSDNIICRLCAEYQA